MIAFFCVWQVRCKERTSESHPVGPALTDWNQTFGVGNMDVFRVLGLEMSKILKHPIAYCPSIFQRISVVMKTF
jgi:hypothetical protein